MAINIKYTRSILLISMTIICFAIFLNTQAQDPKDDSTAKRNNNKDVIINVAYGTQPAWMVSGAISTVQGSEMQKTFTSNLLNTLNGRLPGLTVSQNKGEPGADVPTLYIRGLSTFGPGSSPLILVDGFEGFYEQLTPEEIESATLLKDASATAIYGSRGANGVLLITTKKGKAGPLVVNFSTRQGLQSPLRLPDYLGSYDYASLYNEALNNDGQSALYTADDLAAYKSHSDPFFHPDVDWYKAVLKKSTLISNYNMNLQGGTEDVRYFVSLNYLNNNGLYKDNSVAVKSGLNSAYYRKYNFRSNVDINVTKRLTASFNLAGAISDKSNPADSTTSSIFAKINSIAPNAFPVYNPNGSYGGNGLTTNPKADIIETGIYSSNSTALSVNLKLKEELDMITKGLSISGATAFNNFSTTISTKTRQYDRFSILNNGGGDTAYTNFGQKTSLSGTENSGNQWQDYSVQGFLNYDRTFDKDRINAMLLYSNTVYTASGNSDDFKHIGTGGRFTYSNQEKYIGEFSFGYNGSENFPKDKRFGFFPAGSVAWIASKEAFLKGNNIFNYLKLRGSYGLTGNDNIGGQRFMFNPYYTFSNGYYLGTDNTGTSGISEGITANPNVTWEKEKQLNVGIEATILHHLDITVDWFKKDRYDILAFPYRDVPSYLGLDLAYLNVGKVNNKGFEVMIRYNGKESAKLQYFIEANVWGAKNKVLYNSEAFQENKYLYRTGNPIGQPFLLEAIGFFKDQADINASPSQVFDVVKPGDIKYKDQNHDGIIDANDFYPIGKTGLPELTATLQSGLKYKGFYLDVLLQGVSGLSVYLGNNYFQAFQNNGKISSFALGRWTPQTAATATYPRLSANNNLNNFQPSSFWQRDGSFIKLRSIELGYNFAQNLFKKIGVNQAKVFVNGNNLFSLDHIHFTDPEILTGTGYPAVATLSIGASILF